MKKVSLQLLIFTISNFLVLIIFSIQFIFVKKRIEKKYISQAYEKNQNLNDFVSKIIKNDLSNGNYHKVKTLLLNSVKLNNLSYLRLIGKNKEELFCISTKDECTSSSEKIKMVYSVLYFDNENKHILARLIGGFRINSNLFAWSEIRSIFVYFVFFLLILNIIIFLLTQKAKNFLNRNLIEFDNILKNRDTDFFIKRYIISEIDKYYSKLKIIKESYEKYFFKAKEISKLEGRLNLAKKVAHDIRSPASALGAVVESSNKLDPQEKRIIEMSIKRINSISEDLLFECREQGKVKSLTMPVSALISEIVNEKKFLLKSKRTHNIEVSFYLNIDNYPIFSPIDSNKFKRVLSNIINNSIESIDPGKDGIVSLTLFNLSHDFARIEVKDNGTGIDQDVVEVLNTSGGSFNKGNGNGIGVKDALDFFKENNGRLKYVSEKGKGTIAVIDIPVSPSPSWFVDKITISRDDKILILDDSEEVHELWKNKLNKYKLKNDSIHLYSDKEFIEIFEKNDNLGNIKVFSDFDLDSKLNGLDLIKKYKLEDRSTIMSSHFEGDGAFEDIINSGVKFLPKQFFKFCHIS